MNVQTVGILAGAAAIGYLIYKAAGGGATISGARQVQSSSGESISLIFKDGFILDEKGRTWV